MKATVEQLVISELGARGDGIAHSDGETIYVPFTAPGDVIRLARERGSSPRAVMQEMLSPGPERVAPACVHFTHCGGCALQHLSDRAYIDFKQQLLAHALRRAGYDAALAKPLVRVPPQARRRVELSVTVNKREVHIGFHAARSQQVVDIRMCPVARPAILDFLPALKKQLSGLKKPGALGGAAITETPAGLDVMLSASAPVVAADIALLRLWQHPALLRLCLNEEKATIKKLYQRAPVELTLNGITVELPPDAFLQATEESAQAMIQIVLEHTSTFTNVADIYSGVGSFAFPLLQAGHKVWAYEGNEDMVAAMHNAARRGNMQTRLEAHTRDLYRNPLPAEELGRVDAAVINPPFNGAEPQAKMLAHSRLRRVIMVSCNPATFARDAAHLREGGYKLMEATPIDQFLWSAQLELVAVFTK